MDRACTILRRTDIVGFGLSHAVGVHENCFVRKSAGDCCRIMLHVCVEQLIFGFEDGRLGG